MTRSRTEMTAYAGVVVSLLCAVSIFAGPWHWLNLAGALALACVPGGAAVMCWIDSGDGAAQAGLTLVLSLALFTIASALLIWATAWHPRVLVALAGACVVSCLFRLRPRASEDQ